MSLWDYLTNKKIDENSSNTLDIFIKNFQDLKETKNGNNDKYFHAKANCESVQRNNFVSPIIFSIGKELYDNANKNITKPNELTLKENLNDSIKDLEADFYGYQQGLKYPNLKCKYILDEVRLPYLDEKY